MAVTVAYELGDVIAALRDEGYDDSEIEEEIGVRLCWCRDFPAGHSDEHFVERREVKPEVERVVRNHFPAGQAEKVLWGRTEEESDGERLRRVWPRYQEDMADLERELSDWERGSWPAPLMGETRPKTVSRTEFALTLAQAFADLRGLDWYTLTPAGRRRFLGLAMAAVDACGRAEERLVTRQRAAQTAARIEARG